MNERQTTVLNTLGDKAMTAREISKATGFTISMTHHALEALEKQGKVIAEPKKITPLRKKIIQFQFRRASSNGASTTKWPPG